MGFSRDSFYRFKDLYEKGGEAALIEMSRRVPNPRNRIGETIERRILEMTLKQPAWGHTRMANELAKEGLRVSPTGVRGVWVRHDLNTMAMEPVYLADAVKRAENELRRRRPDKDGNQQAAARMDNGGWNGRRRAPLQKFEKPQHVGLQTITR